MTDDVMDESVSPEDDRWLTMARDAYENSTDWFDASLRSTIEKAMAHFSNRHAPGSKYHSDSYKYRSKGFRPKTRATVRRNEAAAAVAFFSTQDMVSIQPENDADNAQVASAAILTELLNYRLDDSIPWFLVLIAAYQDALNTGVCISHQYWDFEEQVEEMPLFDYAGNPMIGEDGSTVTQEVRKIVTDKPRVDLVAIENFRIAPASDWADPIRSTPYIIEMIPMFIGDVKEKMASGAWIEYSDGEIQTAAEAQYDSVRAAREGKKRTDSKDVSYGTIDFDTVWVHRNIVRENGEDVIFYTLGVHQRLSDPKPLRDEYKHLAHGERPYAMGFAVMEAHKTFPIGLNELTFGLQEEANEISNQRRDNVSLIMNKRYFAKRTANIDYKSLTRNVPGSITLVDDINSDIRWDSPGDVTGSSYQEQDRVSLDYDEIAGTFSPGSVQSNRQLGETVGGMNMLSNDANVITEYQLRVFANTWVEPVLKQLVKMEQQYETDDVALSIAGNKAKMMQKFGVDKITDEMLHGAVTVRVNVGFGATNPQQRIQRLAMGLGTIGQFAPMSMQGLSAKDVISEVFGALGYKGSERFFPKMDEQQPDPQIMQMQQVIQQLQQQLHGKQIETQGRLQVEEMRQQGGVTVAQIRAQTDERLKQAEIALRQWEAETEAQLEMARMQGDKGMSLDGIKAQLAQTAMKLRTQMQLAAGNRPAQQVATPAFEPFGRAPNGMAFQR